MVPRVLVLFRNQLFGQAVRAILDQAGGIQLIGVRSCDQVTVEGIRSLLPNVIIVERSRTAPTIGCSTEMVEFQLAGDASGVREIFVNLEDGQAWVCDSWHLRDIGRDELLKVILDATNSTSKGAVVLASEKEGGVSKEDNDEFGGSARRAYQDHL